jgi:hypothetical protein
VVLSNSEETEDETTISRGHQFVAQANVIELLRLVIVLATLRT